MLNLASQLRRAYSLMRDRFGHQHWWPGDTAFEVCVGAILVQNTSWTNVERAIANLKSAGVLEPKRLFALPEARLAKLIRPAGYFNVKARRLRSFLRVLVEEYDGRLKQLFAGEMAVVRERLLAIHGIGPETADSLLLYAGGHASFVIDAYTKRIFQRHQWPGGLPPTTAFKEVQGSKFRVQSSRSASFSYDALKSLCESALDQNRGAARLDYWQDYHAQLVMVGKHYCRPREARCAGCPLRSMLPSGDMGRAGILRNAISGVDFPPPPARVPSTQVDTKQGRTISFSPMKKWFGQIAVAVICLAVQCSAGAAVRYVNLNNTNAVAPYVTWATAARDIQDAVDAASPGDEVVVTNGIYQSGGRVIAGALTNRVAVTKALVLRSVNGPTVTEIRGFPAVGDAGTRCVYLTNGAVLAGFTLAQGGTRNAGDDGLERSGGGVWGDSAGSPGAVVSNCVISACNSDRWGGGAANVTLRDCVLTGNSSGYGAGAYACFMTNCEAAGNYAAFAGGGVADSVLDRCVIRDNTAWDLGGGAKSSTLNYCEITNNTSVNYSGGGSYDGILTFCRLINNHCGTAGGGASGGTLNNCTLIGNTAAAGGGGAAFNQLINCVLAGNSAGNNGGGAWYSSLINCTVTGNSASVAGGVDQCDLDGCILYYNTAGRSPNYSGSGLKYSCTTPLPSGGVGNITAEPLLTDSAHISSDSPCRAKGDTVTGVDLDGEPWFNPPSMGCDEFHPGAVTGALSVTLQAVQTNVAVGFAVRFTAQITGHAALNQWDFADGTLSSNRLAAAHSWSVPGDYNVVLRAFNDTNPGGVSATVTVHVVSQPVHYVAPGNPGALSPYTSWATAAATIQDAVDVAAVPGALVLVTNGTYQTGGSIGYGALSNRVAVTKPLVVQSVNGPAVTTILGHQMPGVTNGANAMRCVYLDNDATLAGFTLTQGATRTDGDSVREQSGGGVRAEFTSVVSNCVITANAAYDSGGGASGGTLLDCLLTGNRALNNGGGATEATLRNCALGGNSAVNVGGAIYASVAGGCVVTNNTAAHGGGAYACALNHCGLAGNVANGNGGAANASLLNNCTLTGNTASGGGGAADCALHNSIIYYNAATRAANCSGGTQDFCCTTPLPALGAGNIAAEPQLADAFHLSAGSPCRSAGSAAFALETDLDGEAWTNPPAIGCDEFYAGAITGALAVAVQVVQTNVATQFNVKFAGVVAGHAGANVWNFGDGSLVSNRVQVAYAWAGPGDYPVIFTAFNESNPGGVSATVTVHVVNQPVHYVALGNAGALSPYTSWATAAPDIQSAVDAASVAGALVLVSNGTYQTGARVASGALSNRVAVTMPITVQSLSGPANTVIVGNPVVGTNAVRGVYLASGARLFGFTVTNCATRPFGDALFDASGGGIFCEPLDVVVSNCVVTACTAHNQAGGIYGGTVLASILSGHNAEVGGAASSGALVNCIVRSSHGRHGGGAYQAELTQCLVATNSSSYGGGVNGCFVDRSILAGNSASTGGGGAESSTLNNCLLVGNYSSESGAANYSTLANCTVTTNGSGGVSYSTADNCIIFGNGGDNQYGSELNYCCAEPLPFSGGNNITNAPLFVNAAAGDFRLLTNSPGINAGNNAVAPGPTDLAGLPRILDGVVDMGAYEYQFTPPPPPAPPFATTLSPFGISSNAATLHGMATPNNLPSVAWFEWGQRGSYSDVTAPVSVGNGSGVVHLSAAVSNLVRGLDYQCRLAVSNSAGVRRGAVQMFAPAKRVRVWGENLFGQTNLPASLGDVTAVSGGGSHSLALKPDGTLAAWGRNNLGQTNLPAGLSNVIAVAAGGDFNLALKSDGTVAAWGGTVTNTTIPSSATNVVMVSAGGHHSMALKADGTLVAWGLNDYGQTNIPAGLGNVVGVACGFKHNIVLKDDGTVLAWGLNEYGPASIPPGMSNVVDVAAGYSASMVRKADGTVVVFSNLSPLTNVPPALTNTAAIACGSFHGLAMKEDGALATWGFVPGSPFLPAGLSNAVAASAGGNHSLALVDNISPVAISQTAAGPANHDLVIALAGTDADTDLISFRVISLPANGALYQYAGGSRGALIASTNTLVSDSLGRVIFAPAPAGFGEPYANFTFVAHDGLNDSPPASATLNIVGRPYAHTLAPTELTRDRAVLNGCAVPNGFSATAWFEWGAGGNFTNRTMEFPAGGGSAVVSFNAAISNFVWGADCQFRLVVSNQAAVTFGFPQALLTGKRLRAWGRGDFGQTNVPQSLSNVVAVAAGAHHNLGIKAGGAVVAWGWNNYGQTNVPAGLSNAVSVAAGFGQNIAVRADRSVAAWAGSGFNDTNVPPGLSNVVQVSAGDVSGLAVSADGSVAAWGSYWNNISYVPMFVPPGLSNVVTVSAGNNFFSALKADGTLTSWGWGPNGETNVPAGLSGVVACAAGGYHTLTLKADGTVVAWGANNYGQSTVPPGLSNVVSIAAREFHSLALKADGTVVTWGRNDYGQLNVPAGLNYIAAILAGQSHTLALTSNSPPAVQPQNLTGNGNTDLVIQLSGSDADGDTLAFIVKTLPAAGVLYQYAGGVRGAAVMTNDTPVTDSAGRVIFAPAPDELGSPYASFQFAASDGDVESAPAVVVINEIGPVRAFTRPATEVQPVSARLNGFVAPNGFATIAWFEWGTNLTYGQSTAPLAIGVGSGITHVSQILGGLAGGQVIHFRLVASNASQTVTGADQQFITGGKVRAWGDNSSGQSVMPTNQGTVVAVAGGLSHSLALRADGTVKGWGNNTYAQGSAPASLSNVVAVAAGGFHNIALRVNGTAFAWGRNNFNQTNVPAGATNGVAVAAGGQHSVLLRADGSVVAWGDNSQGQRTVPASLTNAVGIAAGWYHNVALRGDGTVTAWGANTYGQASVPAGLTNVVWVGAGLYHSLALRSDGTLIAWGLNSAGQTNIPAAMTNVLAAAGGGSHNLGLRADNTFSGWGNNASGQALPPASVSNVINFAGGGTHSLALVPDRAPTALDQMVAGYVNADLLIALAGSDPDNDSLTYRISTLPGAGTLYQFDGVGRGSQIGLAGTPVTDGGGRVVFAPAPGQFGSPFTTFNFVAGDGLMESAPALVTVNLGLPAAPTLDATASGVTVDGAFQLAFTGTTNAGYRVWASTNLLDWEVLGLASSVAPGFYLYLDSAATNWPQRFYRATAP